MSLRKKPSYPSGTRMPTPGMLTQETYTLRPVWKRIVERSHFKSAADGRFSHKSYSMNLRNKPSYPSRTRTPTHAIPTRVTLIRTTHTVLPRILYTCTVRTLGRFALAARMPNCCWTMSSTCCGYLQWPHLSIAASCCERAAAASILQLR